MGEALVDLQVVTMAQLKSVISQIEGNTEALNKRLIDIGTAKIKLPTVKRYNGSRTGLKGYLTQILLKIKTKALKLSSAGDIVAYAGIFLTGRALEWFKPYLLEYQENRIITTNLKTKYIFISQDNFRSQMIQMFRDPEEEVITEYRLYLLTQKGSAIEYTTQF